MSQTNFSPVQAFAALKVGGASDKTALEQSGLSAQINVLFAITSSWRNRRDENGRGWVRKPGSDEVLYYPGLHDPAQEQESVLFTPARGSGPYMLTLEGKKWEFTLATTSPAGSDPILQITPQHLQVMDAGDMMTRLRTLNEVLAGKVVPARGVMPKTWSQILPGFPKDLR